MFLNRARSRLRSVLGIAAASVGMWRWLRSSVARDSHESRRCRRPRWWSGDCRHRHGRECALARPHRPRPAPRRQKRPDGATPPACRHRFRAQPRESHRASLVDRPRLHGAELDWGRPTLGTAPATLQAPFGLPLPSHAPAAVPNVPNAPLPTLSVPALSAPVPPLPTPPLPTSNATITTSVTTTLQTPIATVTVSAP